MMKDYPIPTPNRPPYLIKSELKVLPYSKTVCNAVYKTKEQSEAAKRMELFRKRKAACERLQAAVRTQLLEANMLEADRSKTDGAKADITKTDDLLWKAMILFAGFPFCTSKGLEFSYTVKKRKDGTSGGELFISRKEKSITKATVLIAFHKALEIISLEGKVTGPKKLGTFGASYLYPIFIRLFLASEKETEK